jgi:hypothetical protein
VINQVSRRSPLEPRMRDISALTINIPEPIIDPITIIVESNKLSSRLKPVFGLLLIELFIFTFLLPFLNMNLSHDLFKSHKKIHNNQFSEGSI